MTFQEAIGSETRTIYAKMTAIDLSIPDGNIESVVVTSSLLTGSSFEIGTAVAGSILATLTDYDGVFSSYDFSGKEFKLELGVVENTTHEDLHAYTHAQLNAYTHDQLNNTIEYKTLGYFTVTDVTRESEYITLKAVDRMYLFDKEYDDSGLTYPVTLFDVLNDACSQAGVPLATESFANDSYEIASMSFYLVTLRKILQSISELAGGYATINIDGELEIITLNLNDLTPKEILLENYYADGLGVGEVANTVIDNVAVQTGDVISYGSAGTNVYTIVNNIFAQSPADLVGAIYGVLNGLSYASISINWQCDFSMPIGKSCTIEIDTDYALNSYLLNRVITYDGGLTETTKAPAKSDVVKNSVIQGSVKLAVEKAIAEIRVLQDDILLKVSLDDVVASINLSTEGITIDADKITLEGIVTANSYFKVLLDGSIEAVNGKFTGEITATSGKIGRLDITDDDIYYVSDEFAKQYNNSDIARLRQIMAGLITARDYDNYVYDINGSGTITTTDLVQLRAIVAGTQANPNKMIKSIIQIGKVTGEISVTSITSTSSYPSPNSFKMWGDVLIGSMASIDYLSTNELTVSSTFLVSNLNSDMVGGRHVEDLMAYTLGGQNPDIDTYKTTGVVQLYDSTKTPEGLIGILEVLAYSVDWVVQRWTPIASTNSSPWQRMFHNGTTWTTWKHIT